MRDPRTDPYTEDELAGLAGPTHPDGPRKMRPVVEIDEAHRLPVKPVLDRAAFYGAANNTDRDLPAPPPLELAVDPAKWQTMTRGQRRAAIREHRKAGGR